MLTINLTLLTNLSGIACYPSSAFLFSKISFICLISPYLNLLMHIFAMAIKWLIVFRSVEDIASSWCPSSAVLLSILIVWFVFKCISFSTSFQIGFILLHSKKSVLCSLFRLHYKHCILRKFRCPSCVVVCWLGKCCGELSSVVPLIWFLSCF